MRRPSRPYRQAIALIAGVLLFVLVIYTLEKSGVPRSYSIGLSAFIAIAIYMVATFPAGTTRSERFFTANREGRKSVNALASASIVGFPLLYLLGGALYLHQPGFLVVLAIAISGGLAMAGLLVVRQFNATRTGDIAEMLDVRFAGTLAPRLYAGTNAISGIILAACGIAATVHLVAWYFALSSFSAALVVLVCCFLTAALGGVTSIARFAAVATLLVILGLNLPLLVHSINEHGFPIGHLTAGVSAVQPAFELEQQLESLQIPLLREQMTSPTQILDWSSGVQILAGLVLLVATASFPALVQNAATGHDDEIAGTATRRSLLYVGLLTASLFALMAFTEIGFYQSMLGLSLSEARVEAPVIFSWSGRESELLRFCGEMLDSAQAVLLACSGAENHIVNIPDFQFDSTLMLAAAPDIATLPLAFTSLLTLSLIATLMAFTSAVVLSTSCTIISAFYATLPGKVASGRMFMVRLTLLAVLGISVFFATVMLDDPGRAFMLALSISAVTSVPGLIGSFYLRQCTTAAVSTAIGTGFGLTILYAVLAGYGIDFTANTGDELIFTIPGMSEAVPGELAAVFTLPVALIILLGMTIFASRTVAVSNDADTTRKSILESQTTKA